MSRNRVTCQGCKHRSTERQLKCSKGFCTHCGHDILKDRWHRSVASELRHLNFDPVDIERIFAAARTADVHPTELVKLAVISKVFTWDANPNQLQHDRMLVKLVN